MSGRHVRLGRGLLTSVVVVAGLVLGSAPAAMAAGPVPGPVTMKRQVLDERTVDAGRFDAAPLDPLRHIAGELSQSKTPGTTAAVASDAPADVGAPTLTSPVDGSTVSGEVTISATSTAEKVQFSIDGSPLGDPVPVAFSVATIQWPTWGLTNGAHTIAAVDCTITDYCSPQTSAITVDVANDAPVVTSPVNDQTLSGSATFTATAPGGSVAFLVDGIQRGIVSAPYAFTFPVSSIADGPHTVAATSCSTAGLCNGPTSAEVSFRTLSLHPRFTAISPTVFSANNDGRYDTTKATYYLPDTEAARLTIRNGAGTVVRGPLSLGTKAKGTYGYTWNGLTNSGVRAPSGSYTLELSTSSVVNGVTLRGSAVIGVRVDLVAPTVTSITGNGARVYPYRDGYRDYFSPAFTVNEKSTVTLTVKSSTGKVVRTLSGSKVPGRGSLTWNGRNNAGTMVAAGTYYWTLTAQDLVGNRRTSARYSVIVSSKRLVTRTATLVKNGYSYYSAGGSASCAEADTGLSYFARGVWLSNVCDYYYDDLQIAGAVYHFTLPAAVSYSSLRMDSYGFSLDTSSLLAGFANWSTGGHAFTHEILTPVDPAWRTIGSVSATNLVNANHMVEATVILPNTTFDISDYDIGQVRLVATYKVLG